MKTPLKAWKGEADGKKKILENIKRQVDKGAQIPGIPTRGPGGVRWLMNETPLWVE